MKEYDSIANLTKEFLTGKLYKLTMEYVNPDNLRVSVLYEDNYDEQVEYDLEVHPSKHDAAFLGHQISKMLYKVELDRNPNFENALCDYLCNFAVAK